MATRILEHESNPSKPDDASPANPIVDAFVALLRHPTVGATLREIIAAPADEWLGKEDAERISGVKMATICAAARRGEIEIGYAGRSPRVKPSELARWIATKKHPLAKTLRAKEMKDAPVADIYSIAVRAARGGAR